MNNVILRTNATPVYAFLSFIQAKQPRTAASPPKKILDCGAGGPLPPLALFHQHGFETWGIDTSHEQLARARQYCDEQRLQVHLQPGDMRRIPFEDGTFDYVYEHYAMCHLGKQDTALAVGEMYRVLKREGLCFLGVISMDSWPKSLFGQEREPGEFWGEEGGRGPVLHTMFDDQEADRLVSAWEILSKEKRVICLREAAEEVTFEEWKEMVKEAPHGCSPEAWKAAYPNRANKFQYAHTYFFLRKPG